LKSSAVKNIVSFSHRERFDVETTGLKFSAFLM